ncbi:MAG: hypothetical protein ACR2P6_05640 [Gammaproteobacteria bacterium]
MNRQIWPHGWGKFLVLTTALVLAACTQTAEQTKAEVDDHAHHHEKAAMDELGRRGHEGMSHTVSPKMGDELRARLPAYANYTDEQIQHGMSRMGPNYEWYVSDQQLQGDRAVLILAHGFGDHGDQTIVTQSQPLAGEKPTAFAFGMSMMMSSHIQNAIDDLETAGAREIVVVPAVSTRYNTLMRQWQYIFGELDEPAYATVDRVSSDAEMCLGWPPEDHPLIAEIVLDYSLEMSKSQPDEVLIIVAHGPSFEADNKKELAMLSRLSEYIDERTEFASVTAVTLQDDAPPEIRDANVQNLRNLVAGADATGKRALIATKLIGTRVVQAQLQRDLNGLNYTFNRRGLSQHDNFMLWVADIAEAECD